MRAVVSRYKYVCPIKSMHSRRCRAIMDSNGGLLPLLLKRHATYSGEGSRSRANTMGGNILLKVPGWRCWTAYVALCHFRPCWVVVLACETASLGAYFSHCTRREATSGAIHFLVGAPSNSFPRCRHLLASAASASPHGFRFFLVVVTVQGRNAAVARRRTVQ